MANLNKTLTARVPAVAQAATLVSTVAEAVAGTVTSVTYIPDADMTGSATARTLSVINKGQDGNGTTVVATLALTSGVNALDYDSKALTLSATPTNLVVNDGDVLAFSSVFVSTGIVDPGGLVKITVSRS